MKTPNLFKRFKEKRQKELDVVAAKAYWEGYQTGFKDGRVDGLSGLYKPNEIRMILGLNEIGGQKWEE